MNSIAPYLKSITAAAVAGLGVLALALEDGTVSAGEWVNIAIAVLTALGAVWAIPNKDPRALHQDESVQPPNERGATALEVALIALVVVVVLLLLLPGLR